jgi:hypothetical protein
MQELGETFARTRRDFCRHNTVEGETCAGTSTGDFCRHQGRRLQAQGETFEVTRLNFCRL